MKHYQTVFGCDERDYREAVYSLSGDDYQSCATTPPTTIQLETVCSGELALEKVAESVEAEAPFAVILLNMRMPGGLGDFETALEIRKIDSSARITFITAYMDVPMTELRRGLGSNFLLLKKPFDSDELVQHTLLQQHQEQFSAAGCDGFL